MIGGDGADWFRLPELFIRLIRATNEMNRCEPAHGEGLSTQQIRALLFLIRHQGSTIKELASALSLSEARASRLADELAVSGKVIPERDMHDRRLVRLHVSPSASERVQSIYRDRAGALRTALAGATDEEIETFTGLLSRVVEEFEALARRSPVPPTMV